MCHVEVKELLEADGPILEAPVSRPLLTVAHVPDRGCEETVITYYGFQWT